MVDEQIVEKFADVECKVVLEKLMEWLEIAVDSCQNPSGVRKTQSRVQVLEEECSTV